MASPVAINDDYEVLEDQILKVTGQGVLGNDTDTDGDNLAAWVLTNPINPLFDFKTNGHFVYDARYHGQMWLEETEPGSGEYVLSSPDGGDADLPDGFDSLAAGAEIYDEFTYAASDGQSNDDATVRVKIVGVNDDPEADNDSATYQQGSDTSIVIDVVANDSDVDIWPVADTLVVTGLADVVDETMGATESDNDDSDGLSITTLEGGTVTLNGDGNLEYVAAEGFFGIDTIQYTVSDGNGGTDTAELRITVLPTNVAPMALDDAYTIGEDDGETAFASVLGNDTDADDAPLIAAELDDPIASALRRVDELGNTIAGDTGVLVDFNSDGTFDYDPNGEFESLGVGDSAYVAFDYTAYDGHGASDDATVVIEIEGANDDPTGESPDAVKVYEAGLASGSQNHRDENGNLLSAIPIVQVITIDIDDVDANDTPYIAGDTAGSQQDLVGDYGTLVFNGDNTVTYTLDTNADHAALQGHNGGIFDTFTVYAVDSNGGASEGLTVTVEVIDDINFLSVLPVDGTGAPIGTLDTLDDSSVAFATGQAAMDTFTLIPGADGQTLDVVGIPDEFTLADGRTVTSVVYTDTNGNEAVRGTDSKGETFYELVFDPDPDDDPETLLGQYTLTMFQNAPSVIKDLDFSALKAGGPQENPIVENIGFDGGFLESGFFAGPNAGLISANFDTIGIPNNSDDFINPNNAGGIGIGNGNIERLEVLKIDVTGSVGTVTAIEFDVQGVGGGIGAGDILWEAVKNGEVVDSGSVNVDLSSKNAHTIMLDPGVAFDYLFVTLDPADFDSNDKMRINRIATVEEQQADDIRLGFRLNSDDGDGDHSPAESDVPSYEEFVVTVTGAGDGEIDPGIVIA